MGLVYRVKNHKMDRARMISSESILRFNVWCRTGLIRNLNDGMSRRKPWYKELVRAGLAILILKCNLYSKQLEGIKEKEHWGSMRKLFDEILSLNYLINLPMKSKINILIH
jgi:hypothetical protein